MLAVGLLWLVQTLIKQNAAREIATRKADEEFKTRIVTVMDNHLGHIAENQAKTATALDLIVDRLLDAVIPPKTNGAG